MSYISAYGKGADHELASPLSSRVTRPDLLMPVDFGVRYGEFCRIRRVGGVWEFFWRRDLRGKGKGKGKEKVDWLAGWLAGNFQSLNVGLEKLVSEKLHPTSLLYQINKQLRSSSQSDTWKYQH